MKHSYRSFTFVKVGVYFDIEPPPRTRMDRSSFLCVPLVSRSRSRKSLMIHSLNVLILFDQLKFCAKSLCNYQDCGGGGVSSKNYILHRKD